MGDSIPCRQLGFPNLEAFLRSLPEVCSLERRAGQLTVMGVASRATAHVQVCPGYLLYWILSQLFALLDSLLVTCTFLFFSWIKIKLEDTARYAGLLLPPAEGFDQGFFCPLGKKRAYNAVLAHFRLFLVASSNLGNYPKLDTRISFVLRSFVCSFVCNAQGTPPVF